LGTALLILCLVLLIANLYISCQPSPFSARPRIVPQGVVLVPVNQGGLDADFLYTKSSVPQKAIILLGGSDGDRGWSYQPDFIGELVSHGFCV
jgi:hypothetical protein